MTISNKDAAAIVCRRAFGSLMTQQGRGYYVTLELLAIIWGTNDFDGTVLPPCDELVRYNRRSHDFARRLMAADPRYIDQQDLDHLSGDGTAAILEALLASLRVPIPGRRKPPKWLGQHLYPYVGELIHYDAAPRTAKQLPRIERYVYRGAGGLAHKLLRCDPDHDRLEANRLGLRRLVSNDGGSLGKLAEACASHDLAPRTTDPFEDKTEQQCELEHTDWVDHLRNGVRNITGRNLVRAKQVELLMTWIPYAIARHQLDRASAILGQRPRELPVSLSLQNSPVRQAARRELSHIQGLVDEALQIQANIEAQSTDDPDEETTYSSLREQSSRRAPMVAFFTQTMATVGALNAMTGSRYLTLQMQLIEALVCAGLSPGEVVKFDDFCSDILWGQFRIVADPRSASRTGMTNKIDAADLANNADQLASDLGSLGLLTEYSDATRMVHGEVH
jgi:hypothetical protein